MPKRKMKQRETATFQPNVKCTLRDVGYILSHMHRCSYEINAKAMTGHDKRIKNFY